MPKLTNLKAGTVVWIPCELKSGIFPGEQGVKIEVSLGDRETVFGFIPTQDIKVGPTPDQGYVRAVVLHAVNGRVAVLFRGDILSQSNPIVVPRAWLEAVATLEA
jgi:hypothetical protein